MIEACSLRSPASIVVPITLFSFCFSGICRATPKRAVSNGVLRPPSSQRALVRTSFIMAPEQVNQSQIDSDHTANDIPGSEDQVESAQVG